MLDSIGQILWFAMFFTPVITIPLAWRYSKMGQPYRILIGIAWAVVISAMFLLISWGILLRDGLGS